MTKQESKIQMRIQYVELVHLPRKVVILIKEIVTQKSESCRRTTIRSLVAIVV